MFTYLLQGIANLRSFTQSTTIYNHLRGVGPTNSASYSEAFFKIHAELKTYLNILTGNTVSRVIGIYLMGFPKLIGTLVSFAMEVRNLFMNREKLEELALLEKYDQSQAAINAILSRHPDFDLQHKGALISDTDEQLATQTWSTYFKPESVNKFFTIYGPELAILLVSSMFGGVTISNIAWTMLPYAGSYMIQDEKQTVKDTKLLAKFLAIQSLEGDHPLKVVTTKDLLAQTTYDKMLTAKTLSTIVNDPDFRELKGSELERRFLETKASIASQLDADLGSIHAPVNYLNQHPMLEQHPQVKAAISLYTPFHADFANKASEVVTAERHPNWETKITKCAVLSVNLETLSR